jgi:hypothetical protein
MRPINALQTEMVRIEIFTQSIKIFINNWRAMLYEINIKSIRSRSLIRGDLTTASILALEKGSTRIERSGWFVKSKAKSKLIEVKLLMPNLSLKDSQIKLALSL